MMTRDELQARVDRLGPWFHCIDLGGGLQTKTRSAVGEPVEHPRPTWEKVRAALPEDFNGLSVLDVGCNAGFYAVELKRRGAGRVLGVDSQRNLVRQALFVRDALGLDIEYRRMSVYDEAGALVSERHGTPPLPRALAPGESATVKLELRAPHAPGLYTLKLDMVAQHVCWFEERGSEPLTVQFRVTQR